MTNEELVFLAKDGNISALEELYTQNRGTIYSRCKRYITYGYEMDDLMQEAYFVLLRAVGAYSENSGYKFVSYLNNSLKWYFSRYIQQDKNRRDICVLDAPVNEDSDTTRVELLPDEMAEFEEGTIYSADMSHVFEVVKDALKGENNGEMKYNVIHDLFVDGITKTALGKKYDLSPERIRQIEKDALRNLRNPKHKKLQAYRENYIYSSVHHVGLGEFRHTHTSGVEWALLKLEDLQAKSAKISQ